MWLNHLSRAYIILLSTFWLGGMWFQTLFFCYVAGINFFVIAMNVLASVDTGVLENLGREIALVSPGKKLPDFCYSVEECNFTYPQALEAAKTLYKVKQRNYCFLSDSHIWRQRNASIAGIIAKFTELDIYVGYKLDL